MNFGMIDALEKALKGPTQNLNDNLAAIVERLDTLVELTQTTNRLLAVIVEQTHPRPHQRATKKP